jgi:sensor c-di-GMP phosphodiesterase-like protein
VNESPLSASQAAQAALPQATPLIWLWIGLGVVLGVGVLAGILYIRQRLGA